MFNVLLDELPDNWKGYYIDSDFQTGILISQCLEDKTLSKSERYYTAANLLFPNEDSRPPIEEVREALEWFLNGYNYDKHTKPKENIKVMDFDNDQWRIYAAFKSQYGIDLNKATMHWFVFMGLLSNLDECNFTRVIEIRKKKIDKKMTKEEKDALSETKKVYSLGHSEEEITAEEKEQEDAALAEFHKMLGKR